MYMSLLKHILQMVNQLTLITRPNCAHRQQHCHSLIELEGGFAVVYLRTDVDSQISFTQYNVGKPLSRDVFNVRVHVNRQTIRGESKYQLLCATVSITLNVNGLVAFGVQRERSGLRRPPLMLVVWLGRCKIDCVGTRMGIKVCFEERLAFCCEYISSFSVMFVVFLNVTFQAVARKRNAIASQPHVSLIESAIYPIKGEVDERKLSYSHIPCFSSIVKRGGDLKIINLHSNSVQTI